MNACCNRAPPAAAAKAVMADRAGLVETARKAVRRAPASARAETAALVAVAGSADPALAATADPPMRSYIREPHQSRHHRPLSRRESAVRRDRAVRARASRQM